jgi:Fe-S cluster assembly scaffold protein SufB
LQHYSHQKGGTQTTDELMWLFGYWAGDGNLEIRAGQTEDASRWGKGGFSTPATDRADRAQSRSAEAVSPVIEADLVERADGYQLAWNSLELAEFFKLNGFEGSASSKRIPQWVWSLPESQRVAFVAGYLDADGTIIDSARRFSIKSVNRHLLEDTASLLVTLGITPQIVAEFGAPRTVKIMSYDATAHGAYRLEFALDSRLIEKVGATLRERAAACPPALSAPSASSHRGGRSQLELADSLEIVDVDVSGASAESVPTWDIEVEGTGNFVSQGFIVHNSKLTMKYPAVYLLEPHAHGEILSVAFAGKGQHQDAGGKVVHGAPHTSSQIISKSISMHGGRATYRGLLKVYEGAHSAKSNVVCDALLMDELSRTDTYPSIEIDEKDVTIGHEASVSKVGEDQLFYLMSRGINEDQANALIVNGFIEPIAKELPAEYSIELYRLVQLQMEGSVG